MSRLIASNSKNKIKVYRNNFVLFSHTWTTMIVKYWIEKAAKHLTVLQNKACFKDGFQGAAASASSLANKKASVLLAIQDSLFRL